MLNSDQKAAIVENLRRVHERGRILHAIDRYGVSYHRLLSSFRQDIELSPEDSQLLLEEAQTSNEVEHKKEKRRLSGAASSIFGILALVGTLIGASLQIFAFFPKESIDRLFSGKEILLNVLIGLLASVIAALLTYFAKKFIDTYRD